MTIDLALGGIVAVLLLAYLIYALVRPERRVVTLKGAEVKLSAKEYDVLRLLVAHAGKVLTHSFILREIWGPANTEDVQYLRVYIRHLRDELEADRTRPAYILTETGVGYRLRAAD